MTEQRTAQVPRVVAKQVPYTYTVRRPRTVVTRVPLDACGNPIAVPAAPVALPAPQLPAPAAASRPMAPAAPATAPQQPAPQAPADGPIKTYSDRPTDQAPANNEGWKNSDLKHVDPEAASAGESTGPTGSKANRPQAPTEPTPATGTSLKLRPIPAPATTQTT